MSWYVVLQYFAFMLVRYIINIIQRLNITAMILDNASNFYNIFPSDMLLNIDITLIVMSVRIVNGRKRCNGHKYYFDTEASKYCPVVSFFQTYRISNIKINNVTIFQIMDNGQTQS